MIDAASTRRARRRRRRPTVAGVLGEVLITAGVVVLLYIAWQLWIGDLIVGAERNAQGSSIAEAWTTSTPTTAATATPTPSSTPTATPTPAPSPVVAPPIILGQPDDGAVFGVVHVPRWGADYAFPAAGGVSREATLDPIGIGHYPDTAMPGEQGNFALAGHRTTYGAPFAELPTLRIGDAVVVETADGWYTYRFRNIEYVDPTAVDVLLPVPQFADATADGTYLTMTTCSPRFSAAERLIAYGVFESFTPRDASNTPPTSLTLAGGA